MNKCLLLTLGIVFLISVQLVSAETQININIEESFSEGENINFNYILSSDNDVQLTFFPHIECPSAPVAPIVEKTINLEKNVPYQDVYLGGVVKDFFEPQACKAYVQILSPFEQTFSKDFKIITNPSFSFETKICKDAGCLERTKVFVKGKSIYLDYSSSVESPSITAVLTYPDKTTKQLTLPISIKAEQIGNYELEITASKQGYKTITKKELFGVIEGEPEIKPKDITKKYENNLLLLFVGITILILFTLVYLFNKKPKRPKLKINAKQSEIKIINEKIAKARNLIREGKVNSAKLIYSEIIMIYNKLPENQKKLLYREVQDLYNKIK